jgi:trehalose synthase
MSLTSVPIRPLGPERFAEILASRAYQQFGQTISAARQLFHGRRVWNINSTARGGGVAEMLASLLAYAQGAGVDARWLVIGGNPSFFTVTKRIHNQLHGAPGDGGPLGEVERVIYEESLRPAAEQLLRMVRPQDAVLLHDPQTAGLAEPLKKKGVTVVWRCHVGLDTPNALARAAWSFLRGHVLAADTCVFTRPSFVWEGLPAEKIAVIAPSIDAFSPKNQEMSPARVAAILEATGMIEPGHAPAGPSGDADPIFARVDGRPGRVVRCTRMYGAPPPPADAPLVVQVSRWDRLKDPLGVMNGFARYVAPHTSAHLILAGPAVAAVADDPEGIVLLNQAAEAWKALPAGLRSRVHLACMPMDDTDENGAIVNALQRRADVVVQKSLAEGFGLTVAEAMWKGRPVVASRIGGIQDQVEHGVTGLLLDDPTDLVSFGDLVLGLLREPHRAERLGAQARERVRQEYLGPRHLTQYFELFVRLLPPLTTQPARPAVQETRSTPLPLA